MRPGVPSRLRCARPFLPVSHIDPAAAQAVQAAVEAALPDALSAALPDAIRAALDSAGIAPAQPERPLITKTQLAEHLGVSLTSVDTLMSRGDIIPIRVGGSVRFSWKAVDDFVRRNAGRSRRRRRAAA